MPKKSAKKKKLPACPSCKGWIGNTEGCEPCDAFRATGRVQPAPEMTDEQAARVADAAPGSVKDKRAETITEPRLEPIAEDEIILASPEIIEACRINNGMVLAERATLARIATESLPELARDLLAKMRASCAEVAKIDFAGLTLNEVPAASKKAAEHLKYAKQFHAQAEAAAMLEPIFREHLLGKQPEEQRTLPYESGAEGEVVGRFVDDERDLGCPICGKRFTVKNPAVWHTHPDGHEPRKVRMHAPCHDQVEAAEAQQAGHHYDDPCRFCKMPIAQVEPGPCPGATPLSETAPGFNCPDEREGEICGAELEALRETEEGRVFGCERCNARWLFADGALKPYNPEPFPD